MKENKNSYLFSDEDLVAYLDGELDNIDNVKKTQLRSALQQDPDLAARLDHLRSGSRPFRQAYDLYLQNAPLEKLNHILDQAVSEVNGKHSQQKNNSFLFYTKYIATAAFFVTGLAYLYSLSMSNTLKHNISSYILPEKNWRQAVAEYQVLYSRDTLNMVDEKVESIDHSLKYISKQIGLELTRENLALNDYIFKRGQILEWKKRPLAQLTYLPLEGAPIAFCITKTDEKDTDLQHETREDLNVIHWVRNGYGLLIIGQHSHKNLEKIAAALKQRLL